MTAQLSRERLEERIRAEIELLEISLKNGGTDSPHNDEELLEVFRIALAGMDSVPPSFDELRDAVAEMTGGWPIQWSASTDKGHQVVPFINFNSLARIVDKFRAAPPAPVADDYFASLVTQARARADKAMRKFPQPNYVLNKVAEESGEVIKAVIHYTEGREEWRNVEGEIIDNLAMLIRLVQEGDQVIGFTPPTDCRDAMLKHQSSISSSAGAGCSGEIKQLSSNEPVTAWIKCSDRMPEDDSGVWVWSDTGYGYAVEAYFDGEWYRTLTDEREYGITHWMPLPAAPEQEV